MSTLVPTTRTPAPSDPLLACAHVAASVGPLGVEVRAIVGETYPGKRLQPVFAVACRPCAAEAGGKLSRVRLGYLIRGRVRRI